VTDAPSFSGAVLVGGRSRRLGVDKAVLFADGVERALRDAGADEVLRIGRGEHVSRSGGRSGLVDDVADVGPLGGIATALRVARHEIVVVLACDLPNVHADGIRMVVAGLDADADVDVALPPGQPLHAAWRRSALPEVLALIGRGQLAVWAAIERLSSVEVSGLDPAWLVNVNEPADLHQTGPMADPAVPEIDVTELARRHAAGAYVVDVRQPDEYEAGHVPGAVLIPLDQLGDRWDEVPEGEVLVICQGGGRSAAAVKALNEAGRTTVNVAGGTKAWIDAGNPVDSGPSGA
jgi:molybdopterin-guanine dinucleotide biosynthesis protein A/rhodanese-related sulfurtransferase